MPAPKGSKNAMKGKTVADRHLHIRIEHSLKSQAAEHAEEIGLNLSEYVCRLLRQDLGIK